MPRNRQASRSKKNESTEVTDSDTVATATQTNSNTKERNKMATVELTDDAIAELLAGSKQRGEYTRELSEFAESGVKAVQVSLSEGTFAGKKIGSVKTGFENARKKLTKAEDGTGVGPNDVRVIAKDGNLFLVRADLATA